MSRPLRVAHVVATVGNTGVESYLLTLLSSFARDEVEPVLFVPGPGPLVERLRSRGIAVELGAPRQKLAFGAAGTLAARWKGQFDLVHAHGPRASFWAERAARLAALPPPVLTVHELRWQTLPPSFKRALWLRLEAGVLLRARQLIVISTATERDLLARYPALTGRTHLVHASTPLLLDPDRLLRARPGMMRGAPMRLVTIGRFTWQKGYDLLLLMLAALLRRGVEFRLSVVGHGTLEAELREQARRLGVLDHIEWLGAEVDLPQVLADAHAFVTTTRAEMFGIAVLEAMAVGLPVLAPAVGSLPEVVIDGESGRLLPFEPESNLPERCAEVLAYWAAQPDEAAALGAGGHRRARAAFAPEAMARGVTAVYRAAVEPQAGCVEAAAR